MNEVGTSARAQQEAPPPTEWWIATDLRRNNGERLLGPFGTSELALQVRRYYERASAAEGCYAVDAWPAE